MSISLDVPLLIAILPHVLLDGITLGFMYALIALSYTIEITCYTSPCFNIKPRFLGGDFARVSQKRHPGWSRVYAKVLQPGTISQGDPVRLLDSP